MASNWVGKAVPIAIRACQLLGYLLSGAAAVTPVIKGLALEWVFFFALSGLAFATIVSYYALRLGDYVQGLIGTAQMGRVFADALIDRRSVGEPSMTTNRAAEIWNEVDDSAPRTPIRSNTKFRWLKNAVDNGHIPGAPLNENGQANRNTVVQATDLIAFFVRRDWRQLVNRE